MDGWICKTVVAIYLVNSDEEKQRKTKKGRKMVRNESSLKIDKL